MHETGDRMFVVSPEEFERKRPLFERYFNTGYCSFQQFCDAVSWSEVELFEKDPTSVLVDYKVVFDKTDMLRAKMALWNWVSGRLKDRRMSYFEFGVRAGVSMRWVSGANADPASRFYGFDTFTGLPDGWVPAWGTRGASAGYKAGDMAVSEIPSFGDERVKLYPGLFQDTLFKAIDEISLEAPIDPRVRADDHVLVINNDGDTYTAALFTLTTMFRYLRKGDILYFDEFFDTLNEFAAFNDFARSFYFRDRVKLLGRAYDACVFEVIR
jgi:hypothetical protein